MKKTLLACLLMLGIYTLRAQVYEVPPTTNACPADTQTTCNFVPNLSVVQASCNMQLTWTFSQCYPAKFYIQYSSDAINFYTIGMVTSNSSSSPQTYSFTDNSICATTVTYRLAVYSINSGCLRYSNYAQRNVSGTCCVDRCAQLPNRLTILGEDGICNGASQTYSLSVGYPAQWTVTPTTFVTVTGGNINGNSITITNNTSSPQTITLTANVYGCRTITKTINLNPCITEECPTLAAMDLYNGVGGTEYWCSSHAYNGYTLFWNYSSGTATVEFRSFPSMTLIATTYGASGTHNLPAFLLPPANGWYSILATNDCNPNNTIGMIVESVDCSYMRAGSKDGLVLSIYPNPVVGSTLNASLGALDKGKKVDIEGNMSFELVDLFTSQTIRKWAFKQAQPNFKLDIAGIKKGQYVLRVIAGKKTVNKQVSIQ